MNQAWVREQLEHVAMLSRIGERSPSHVPPGAMNLIHELRDQLMLIDAYALATLPWDQGGEEVHALACLGIGYCAADAAILHAAHGPGSFVRICTCEAKTDINTVEHFGRCALRPQKASQAPKEQA